LIINQDGKEILLPKQKAAVGAIILPTSVAENTLITEQPYVIVVYNNKPYNVPIKYAYIEGELIDFGTGEEACVFLIPRISQGSGGIQSNPIGAAIFISPRLMRGMFSQVYLLNDALDNFPNFKIAHSEPNFVIESLNSQGMNLPEFVYYQGVQGPIKIWEITYTGKEELKEEYIDTDPKKYLSWRL